MTAAGTDQGSTEKMSTALVSAFYDVGDVLYKNQKNNNMQWKPDRKAVGSPVGTTGFPRRHSTSSVSPTLRELGNSKYSNTLISIPDGGLLLTGNNKENHQGNGKRDRLQSDGGEGKKSNINSSRYKTELCRPFEENGHCKYGDKCQFAHGVHELRTLARHPKYKTELCRTFHTIGFCPYGPRCHFIHNPEERAQAQQSQSGSSQSPRQNQHNSHRDRDHHHNERNNHHHNSSRPRPPLQHSVSLPGPLYIQDSPPASPISRSPPPGLSFPANDDVFSPLPLNANNAFTYAAQDIPNPMLSPVQRSTPPFGGPPSPDVFSMQSNGSLYSAPPSPPDSLAGDRDLSPIGETFDNPPAPIGTTGAANRAGSEYRLPCFSRLSESDP
ncbi:PREDICTED: mRNA decay activator protein ZFP36L2-like [Branchiostoma belcheri]|uniref:mRNA decay activator protein ZFP36L2-like n=1 Tax=Branchiostoma belcheri TaxID=7741 RepID=A0A6P4Y9K4_BRABE|nr:PREDICTED: mRNA decay activator protein ZFP36L2-like [Branchiostoma belcheri]KAI8478157.1 hypothetical protein Bbelb_441130 [Branchiostoma belcheri]KAI8478440.1 hypothetical protein Bbelb_438340 [Branchiostoma belcheri]